MLTKRMKPVIRVGVCRCCKCTSMDCRECVERTGEACRWVNPEHDLCSACICDNCGLDAQGQLIAVHPRLVLSGQPKSYIPCNGVPNAGTETRAISGGPRMLYLGEVAEKLLPDGRRATVIMLTFDRGRITVSPPGDLESYSDAW
jgi:hypothetical protein